MRFIRSFLKTLFAFMLVGPLIGGLGLLAQDGMSNPLVIGLVYVFGILPAALAGIINWSILVSFNVVENHSYYWPCILITTLCMTTIDTIFPNNFPDWNLWYYTAFIFLQVWACAHVINKKAWDTLDT